MFDHPQQASSYLTQGSSMHVLKFHCVSHRGKQRETGDAKKEERR